MSAAQNKCIANALLSTIRCDSLGGAARNQCYRQAYNRLRGCYEGRGGSRNRKPARLMRNIASVLKVENGAARKRLLNALILGATVFEQIQFDIRKSHSK
jgi:hypothetical protein